MFFSWKTTVWTLEEDRVDCRRFIMMSVHDSNKLQSGQKLGFEFSRLEISPFH